MGRFPQCAADICHEGESGLYQQTRWGDSPSVRLIFAMRESQACINRRGGEIPSFEGRHKQAAQLEKQISWQMAAYQGNNSGCCVDRGQGSGGVGVGEWTHILVVEKTPTVGAEPFTSESVMRLDQLISCWVHHDTIS